MHKLLAVMSLIALSACSHNVHLRGYSNHEAPIATIKGKRVAVVIEKDRVIDAMDTKTDVYTYKFQSVTEGLAGAFRSRLRTSAKEIEIFTYQEPKKDFDIYIYPTLTYRSVHDFWTMGCFVTYKIEVRNKNQKVLATNYGEGKASFFSASQADEKCREAMSGMFDTVTGEALDKIKL